MLYTDCIALGALPELGSKEFKSKKNIDVKDYTTVNELLIKDKSIKGVVLIGSAAVRSMFPNAHPAVFDAHRFNLCVMPYEIQGRYVPFLCINPLSGFPSKTNTETKKPYSESEYKRELDGYARYNKQIFKLGVGRLNNFFEPVTKPFNYKPVLDSATFNECIKKLASSKTVAFDFETHKLSPHNDSDVRTLLYSIAFTFDDWTTYAIPLEYWRREWDKIYDVLKRWATEPRFNNQLKIAHNLAYDLKWLLRLMEDTNNLNKNWGDTQFMSYLLDERAATTGLKFCAWRYLGKREDWSKNVDVTNLRRANRDDVLKYNAEDTHFTMELYHTLVNNMSDGMSLVYEKIMLPSAITYTKVTDRGVDVNIGFLKEKKVELEKKLSECKNRMIRFSRGRVYQTTGDGLLGFLRSNSTLNADLLRFGTDAAGLKNLVDDQKKRGGYSQKRVVDVCEAVMESRLLEKMLNTYIDGTLKFVTPDEKIHSETNLIFTVSGRTSASKPNLQNVPKRDAGASEIRKWVVAPPGHTIVAADMGQIEARVFAVVSGDKNFVKLLFDKYDIHMDYSLYLFNNNKELAKEKRSIVKAGVFALFYGAFPDKIARTIGISVEKAEMFKDKVFKDFPSVPVWQEKSQKFLKDHGYLESLFGRRRRAPISKNQALNFIPQSTASDMTLIAMNKLAERYKVIFTVHDDITFVIPDNELDESVEKIASTMVSLPWTVIRQEKVAAYAPLGVEVAVGKNWGDMKEIYKTDGLDFGLRSVKDCFIFNNMV